MAWLKAHYKLLIIWTAVLAFFTFVYSCEPKVTSLNGSGRMVTRQELQLELNNFMRQAEFKMAELDKQEQLRNLVFQNALILTQEQPLNPVGIITGLAALYGIGKIGSGVAKTISKKRKKKEANNA